MIFYFLFGVLLAGGLAYGAYYLLQNWVLEERLDLDDAKGYYLIGCIVLAFLVSASCFYFGQLLGYGQDEHSSTLMALCILLDIMATLLVLIYGLVKFREPEHY